ncbi:Structural maintenance of chromosomes protein 5 [Mycena venus]|uniref:Structural maintenance of chromosomes protein 5 n=1 Tax=Mycena venus TaxID=2733690 RepID=A0A8H6YSS5_9AGAR|nr:Structural maintenance of chromosomes protein 5 [Mycena venus]
MQLRNSVTYDFVGFRPAPYLNMILGPTGTGKSSIACATCIRLDWPPKILGCATELPPFAESGHIEIELKILKGEGILVISGMLSAKAKSSTFTIGWKSASGAEVTERVARLNNEQVRNLCSFLSQNKVSAFAAMFVELLRETQNAVRDECLKGWNATLVEAGAQLKEVTEIALLTVLIPVQHYREARSSWLRLKM